jgi:hypothetical protein
MWEKSYFEHNGNGNFTGRAWYLDTEYESKKLGLIPCTLAEKWKWFEESLRVPLVIYDPRMPDKMRGTVNHDWTLNIELASTI